MSSLLEVADHIIDNKILIENIKDVIKYGKTVDIELRKSEAMAVYKACWRWWNLESMCTSCPIPDNAYYIEVIAPLEDYEKGENKDDRYISAMVRKGFKKIQLWVPPENVEELTKYAVKLRKDFSPAP